MALDNAKLKRAVNTTEKLVKRMDAFEAKRKDADPLSSQEKKRLEDLRVKQQRSKLSSKEQDEMIDLVNKRRAARGDDYGHPVKTRDNRVQETGRMDGDFKESDHPRDGGKFSSGGGGGKKSTKKYEDPGNKSESDIEWEAERASIKHGGRAKNPYEPGSKAHGIWGKAHG